MNSISVKLTFTDDELYENFVEPRKINGDLPTLVLRLLTAYATNDDLAYQIDQFIDKDSEPDVCAAREAIMRAVARLNGADASISQELEAMSSDAPASEDDDFDIVTGDDTEAEPFVGLPEEWVNDAPAPVPVAPVAPTPVSPAVNAVPTVPNDNNVVLQSINALTSQVATLTDAITLLVQGGGLAVTPAGITRVAPAEPVVAPVENSVESVETSAAQPNMLEQSAQTVENSVETVELSTTETVSAEDEYEIPSFMQDMLSGLT